MKKNFTSWIIAAIALLTISTTFTSCEDEQIAYDLEGYWEGTMFQEYNRDGYTYAPNRTEIDFYRDHGRSGHGYWVDYFRDRYGTTIEKYYIKWEVIDGNIRIYFPDEDLTFWINNYRLTDRRLSGTFTGRDRTGSFSGDISLYHIDSPNWYSYSSYYYAPTRSSESSDSISNARRMSKDCVLEVKSEK